MPRQPKEKKPISVVDRRLQSGSVFSASSRPIPLVEPDRWTMRVINTGISEQRLWEIQADKGWVYAEVADLAVDPVEVGFRVQDGRIVRGVQGAEVLMKMETADYRRIQKAKDAANKQATFGSKQLKQDILARAGSEVGAQGADFLAKNINRVSVQDSREAVSLEE